MNPNSPASTAAKVSASAEKSALAPAHILLVDDDPVNQSVARSLLRRRGFEAELAANGKEALEKLAGRRFDLILMDLQMPELDGFQTATIIRQNESQKLSGSLPPDAAGVARESSASRDRHIPIIALTTASAPGTRERCLEAGMDDYLTKPIVPVDLFAVIEKYLGAREE
jgi:CheY-like chemotaxis protein